MPVHVAPYVIGEEGLQRHLGAVGAEEDAGRRGKAWGFFPGTLSRDFSQLWAEEKVGVAQRVPQGSAVPISKWP